MLYTRGHAGRRPGDRLKGSGDRRPTPRTINCTLDPTQQLQGIGWWMRELVFLNFYLQNVQCNAVGQRKIEVTFLSTAEMHFAMAVISLHIGFDKRPLI